MVVYLPTIEPNKAVLSWFGMLVEVTNHILQWEIFDIIFFSIQVWGEEILSSNIVKDDTKPFFQKTVHLMNVFILS